MGWLEEQINKYTTPEERQWARATFIDQPRDFAQSVSDRLMQTNIPILNYPAGFFPFPAAGAETAEAMRGKAEAEISWKMRELEKNYAAAQQAKQDYARDRANDLIKNNPAYSSAGGGQVRVQQSDGSVATINFDALVDQVAGLIPAAPSIPDFEFDWYQAEFTALQKLEPYYTELLEEANFDMNLAIQRLNEDYATGTRQAREDYVTVVDQTNQDYFRNMGYRQQDAARLSAQQMQDMGLTIERAREDFVTQREELGRKEVEESRALTEEMAKRGLLQSTIREEDTSTLEARQRARREAIQQALQRKEQVAELGAARGTADIAREAERTQLDEDVARGRMLEEAELKRERGIERLTTPYQRALEDIDIQYPRYVRDLGEQKKQRAAEMAQMEYERDWDRYYQEQMQNLGSYIG